MNFGVATFLFCAPMWLLGAHLAERYRSGLIFSDRLPPIWMLRALLPLSAVLSIFLFYHAPIHIPLTWSVLAFVPVGYIWLSKELQRLTSHRTIDILERFGTASYSMYLVHRFPLTFFSEHLTLWPGIVFYCCQAVAIAFSTFAFFRLVEHPAHRLAKRLGRTWDNAAIAGIARAR
jgi:peptidoglycan/LPS O-acetylase OafA/YrhL